MPVCATYNYLRQIQIVVYKCTNLYIYPDAAEYTYISYVRECGNTYIMHMHLRYVDRQTYESLFNATATVNFATVNTSEISASPGKYIKYPVNWVHMKFLSKSSRERVLSRLYICAPVCVFTCIQYITRLLICRSILRTVTLLK